MAEILKSWLIEFKKVRHTFGESDMKDTFIDNDGKTVSRCRICPYCRDSRPIGANTVKLTDRFCPNCGKAIKIKEEK